MICKEVNYELAMDEWGHLLDSGGQPDDQIAIAKASLAGLKAEKEMAYYLNVRFGQHPELMVFNNLKVEHRGLSAQIDHLVLSRWSAYFIETKSVGHKININADGQWARMYGRKYRNIESPIEQSRRHESILFDMLESRLPAFMGRVLGMQKTFRKLIDVQHLVAISVGAVIQGRGKKAVSNHLRAMDQIPQMIADNHDAVRANFMGNVLAEVFNSKHKKRLPAFNDQEFSACCQFLLSADISQSPLQQVHAFIETLPQQAAALENEETEPAKPPPLPAPVRMPQPPPLPAEVKGPSLPPPPPCPKCGGPMAARTASRGDRAGKQFYGCTRYHSCRGIINFD